MFRKRTTFNTHDTSAHTGKRHAIDHGVDLRCNLIMEYMVREYLTEGKGEFGSFDADSACAQPCIVSHMKGIDSSYTSRDVIYALKKLESEGFIVRSATMDGERGWVWYSLRYNPTNVKVRFKQAA